MELVAVTTADNREINNSFASESLIWTARQQNYFMDRYGIPVEVGPRNSADRPEVEFTELPLELVPRALETLRQELALYPANYLNYCQVSLVKFVRMLKLLKNAYIDQPTPARGVAFSSGEVYLVYSPEYPLYSRRTYHHEFLHRADQSAVKKLRSKGARGKRIEERWRANWISLNSQSTGVYLGKTFLQMSDEDRKNLDLDGFTRAEGRIAVAEDRATVAEYFMFTPRKAQEAALTYPVLKHKIRRIKTDMYIRSNGLMDDKYFEMLMAGEVDENYWN